MSLSEPSASQEELAKGHLFHIEAYSVGSYRVAGDPTYREFALVPPRKLSTAVRAWSLSAALVLASEVPLLEWKGWDIEGDPDVPDEGEDRPVP